MNENKRLKRKIALGFIAALIISIFISFLSYVNLIEQNKINREIERTHYSTRQIENILMTVQSIVANQRSFIISGNESSLNSLNENIEKYRREIREYKVLVGHDERKLLMAHEFDILVEERINLSNNVVEIYHTTGRDSAVNYLLSINGPEMVVLINNKAKEIRDETDELLMHKSKTEKERSDYTRLAILLSSVLILSFIIIALVIIYRDINIRSKIEDALKQKEKLFRTVIHNFPEGSISVFDKKLRYLIYDGSAIKELGLISDQIENKKIKSILPEELYSTLHPFFIDALNGNKNSIEINYGDKTFFMTFLPLEIDRKIEGGIVITQNITKRKIAEDELKNSEAFYRAITENFPNGTISIFNEELKLLKVNGMLNEAFGYSKEEIEGKLFKDILPDHIFESIKDKYLNVFKGESVIFDQKYNGRHFFIVLVPMMNERGEILNGMSISQDVTKLKEYEEKIIQSRDFYLTLFEEFPSMIWQSDVTGKLNYFNKTWLEFTGRTLEDELDNGWKDIIHPDDLYRFTDIYGSSLDKKTPFTMEHRMKRHDGNYRWIRNHGSPYFNMEGNFSGFIGSCYDITASKNAEYKQERGRQLTTLLQNISTAANEYENIEKLTQYSIDRVSEFMKWEIGHLLWFDPIANELVSSNIWNSNLPKKYNKFREVTETLTYKENQGVIGKVLKTKRHIWMTDIAKDQEFVRKNEIKELDLKTGFAFPIKVKNEIVSVMEFYTQTFVEEDKELMKIVDSVSAQIGRAIERQWAQDALRESEEKLEKAQMIAHIGNWIWNIKDNSLEWSDELYRIYGLDHEKEKITFDKFVSLLHPDEVEPINKIIENSLENKKNFEFDHRIIRSDGVERILHGQGEVISDEKGNVTSIVGTGQDITEMKIAENKLREANKKLQEAQKELIQSEKLAALGRISSNMAHEIRNPLANIRASSQLLLAKYKEDNILKSYLDIIIRNTETANRIIRELLDFASPREIKLKKGNINKVIDSVTKLVEPRCQQNNIKLMIDNRLDKEYELLMNEKKLEEALLNFISNSIEAMPEGGSLVVVMKYDEYNEEVVVNIEDTGYGIPQENLDKVFEPFFTTKDHGTGLGMGLSHQIIKSHNGKLNINSEIGVGTTIEIKFPVITKTKSNGKADNDS
jgi:PAS domain S-box-containing protein